MSYKCQVDLAHDLSIFEFFKLLENFGNPKVVEYIANGPAGGNPCINLSFDDRNKCIEFLKDVLCEDEDDDFIESQIF